MVIRWDNMRFDKALIKRYQQKLGFSLNKKLEGSIDVNILREEFEKKFSKYIGVNYSVSLNSGTEAFELGLDILGIKKGDSVIIPNIIYATIPLSLINRGIEPIIVPARESLIIDEKKIEKRIKKNTKAIIVSHLSGRAAEMETVKEISKKYGLYLIEDTAQSFGSEYKDRKLGSFGDISFFSFAFGKPLSSCGGLGGMLCFNKEEYKKTSCIFTKNYFIDSDIGKRSKRYSRAGFFDLLVLDVKFDYLDSIFKSRYLMKGLYEKELDSCNHVMLFKDNNHIKAIPGLHFVLFAKERNGLELWLQKSGIYLVPWRYPCSVLSNIKTFNKYCKGNYDIGGIYLKEALYLPLFSFIKKEEVLYVTDKIKEFYKRTYE